MRHINNYESENLYIPVVELNVGFTILMLSIIGAGNSFD